MVNILKNNVHIVTIKQIKVANKLEQQLTINTKLEEMIEDEIII